MDYQSNYVELLELLNDSRSQAWLAHPATRKSLVSKFYLLFWWYYFAHYHHRSIPEYKVHQSIHALDPRVLIIEPRDHGKSIFWSCGFPLWVMLTNPSGREVEHLPNGAFRYFQNNNEVISQISCGGELAKKWIRRHKIELQHNKKLIEDWGYQSTAGLREGIWTSDEIVLRNGAHCYSKGSGAQIRGDHPTRILVDDLEDRIRSQSPVHRQADREYFFGDLYGALSPESQLVIVGTIVHTESLLKQLYDREIIAPPGLEESPLFTLPWTKFLYKAIKPDGTVLAPEIWSYERLMLRKAELPPSIWRTEYMNSPTPAENPLFPEQWLTADASGYIKDDNFVDKIEPGLKIYSYCDPAAKEKESNDYTAVVTVGLILAKRPKVYVLEVKRFRKPFLGQLQEALNTWIKWTGRLGFEGIAYQHVLKSAFEDVCKNAGYNPDVYETDYRDRKERADGKSGKQLDKITRAHLITHFFELGWIKFNHADMMQQILIEDLRLFPTGEHDDTVDALVGCLWEIDRVLRHLDRNKSPKIQTRWDTESGEPIYIGPN